MKINDFVKQVQNKEINIVEYTHKVLEECKKINKEYHYFNTISEELAIKQAEAIRRKPFGKLSGVFVSVKDSICVKDIESTAGSKILKGYKPTFNATVVQKAIDEGAIIIGKTSQDEFGFGSFSTNVGLDFDIPLNPFDKKRVTGGSSGGAAGLTQKASFPHIALGQSTGGSIVNPASFCGVYGLCPTYGLVSRYGLIDYANSLDKIGPITKDIDDINLALNTISGYDEKDSTSIKNTNKNIETKKPKIGIIKEAFSEGVDQKIQKQVWNYIKELESKGYSYKEISLPTVTKYGIPTYYLLASTEASTNLAKYCGMRYGNTEELKGTYDEYFTKVRSNNFGKEAKRRIILGTFARMSGFRDAYYIKAAKVRTLIIQEYKKSLKDCNVLISPTMPILPPTFKEAKKLTPLQDYMMDILTVGPNLAGLPHLNVPLKTQGSLPIGALLISDHLKENLLIQVAKDAN